MLVVLRAERRDTRVADRRATPRPSSARRISGAFLRPDLLPGGQRAVRGSVLVDSHFAQLPSLIPAGDLLVLNTTRVRHARLLGTRASGAPAEVLLIHPGTDGAWVAMGKPGSALQPGKRVTLGDGVAVETVEVLADGHRLVRPAHQGPVGGMVAVGDPPAAVEAGQGTQPPHLLLATAVAAGQSPGRRAVVGAHHPGTDDDLETEPGGERFDVQIRAGGGEHQPVNGKGWFVQATVFADVKNEMTIAKEEIFGPVLAVIPFEGEAEAVAIANDSAFGLAAGLWTKDLKRGHRVAHQLEAGTVWVNAYNRYDTATPFGGYKESGFGREGGAVGLRPYVRIS